MKFRVCFIAVAVLAAIHVIIGSDPLAVLIVAATMLVGLTPVMVYGVRNLGAVLTALLALRYVGFGAIFKLLQGETLDSGLYAPTLSFTVILVGTMAVLAAFGASRLVPVGRDLFRPAHNPMFLARLAWASAALGLGARALLIFATEKGELHNALLFLTPFTTLAVIANTAACILRSDGRRSFDFFTLALFAALFLNSLVISSRQGVYVAVIAYLVTCLAYGKTFRPVQIMLAGVAAYIFVVGLSPAMIEVRRYRDFASPVELVRDTMAVTVERLLGRSDRPAWESDPRSNYQLFYVVSGGSSLGRFVLVQQADIVIATASNAGKLGYAYVTGNLANMLPRFINPEKNVFGQTDFLFWYYGLRPWGLEGHIGATLFGEAFAVSGWEAVIIFGFIIPFAWFVIFKKIGNDPIYNIWPVFFFVLFVHTFTEQGINTNLFQLLRTLPTVLILLVAVIGALRLIGGRKSLTVSPVAAKRD